MRRIKLKDMELIAKMASNFSKRTGIEYMELYAEASLAFCEAMINFNPESGAHINYVSRCVKNRLITFARKYNAFPYSTQPEDFEETDHGDCCGLVQWDKNIEQFEFHNSLSKSLQEIANIIQENPQKYLSTAPKYARGLIYKRLREMGWKWSDIWQQFAELKTKLNEKPSRL